MKKIFIFLFIFFSFSLLFAAKKTTFILEPIQTETVTKTANSITTTFDNRIEVIEIICRLAGIPDFTNSILGDNSYTQQIDTLFSKQKDHKAVKTVQSLYKKGLTGYDLLQLAVFIKPDFSGTTVDLDPVPEIFTKNLKKVKSKDLYNFISQVHDFIYDSNYLRISILLRPKQIEAVGYLNQTIQDCHILEFFQDFFGKTDFETPQFLIQFASPSCNKILLAYNEDNKIVPYYSFSNYNSILDFVNAVISFETYYLFLLNEEKYIKNFQTLYLYYIKDSVSEIEYKYLSKNPSFSFTYALDIFNVPIIQEYLNSDYFQKFLEKEPTAYTLPNSYYSVMEKTTHAAIFKGANTLIKDYKTNQQQYKSFSDFFPKIIDYINNFAKK